MAYEQILFEQRGSVGLITLNRPERLNAWTDKMQQEMRDALEHCNGESSIGAIVFTGAGRAYCAGADISGWANQIEGGGRSEPSATRGDDNWVKFLQRQPKPTIAALNGTAVGVGITHVLPMDIRIAADTARVGMFFIKMGLVPELASSHFLAQMVGTARAIEWCFTGRMIEATEARDAGLISEVVPADALLDRALELGETLAGQPPAALAMIRDLFNQNALEPDVDVVMKREGEALARARESDEHKEAVKAFMEKRPPVFRR